MHNPSKASVFTQWVEISREQGNYFTEQLFPGQFTLSLIFHVSCMTGKLVTNVGILYLLANKTKTWQLLKQTNSGVNSSHDIVYFF